MRPYCASFYTKYARPNTWTEDLLFFFFCQEEKLSSPCKRIWWSTIYIFCLQSREKLEKIIFHTISNLGEKKKTLTSNENLQGYLKHMHTCIAFLINVKKKTNRDIFFRSIDRLVHSLDDLLFPLKSFKVFPSFSTISCDCITYPYMLYTSFNTW